MTDETEEIVTTEGVAEETTNEELVNEPEATDEVVLTEA